jgi:FHA domain-containing protein
MKLTVQQRPDDPGLIAPWSTVFHAPGGTIGRSPDNALRLPDPQRGICRVQAAVRVNDQACYLINLSRMSEVRVNGRQIGCDQAVPLAAGDELQIGPYTILAQDPHAPTVDAAAGAAAPAVADAADRAMVHAADPAAADAATPDAAAPDPLPNAAATARAVPAEPDPLLESPLSAPKQGDDDVFSDLFGPGTLPVGSAPDVDTHPFDMPSGQDRNPEDPLRRVPHGDANVSGPARDPLDLLDSRAHDTVEDVFTDPTPSTLRAHDPLAPHRLDPVRDTLAPEDDGAQDR